VDQPPLKPLHPDESLILLKLAQFRGTATEELLRSLAPGQLGALKVRLDGTILMDITGFRGCANEESMLTACRARR
jgi:hypothetical protein